MVGLAAIGGYLGFLGWDQQQARGADGYLHGPYQAWQVVSLVVVLGGAAIWSGWRRHQFVGTIAAAVVMTVAWSIDAATSPGNDGLWPVGAVLIAVGTAVGFLAMSSLMARGSRGQRTRR